MNIVEIRADIQHADEQLIKQFIENTLKSKKWMYCKEFKKNEEKTEHFHLMVYTKYHEDTVRRKYKKTFPNSSGKNNQWKIGKVNDIIKYISYLMKDGDYYHKNIKDKVIEEATVYMENMKEELLLKKLDKKCLLYLSRFDKYKLITNGDIMMVILQWFKEKKLNYPSQYWMKSTMIKYWMDVSKDKSEQEESLKKLYGINNAFIKYDL